ncbi:beta-galactosidase [Streptomyces sp. M2CJ-2]|uniref:beta-galactosidase n=1 Tax=Streptomyces sp. M2CJ-2 TaxID=2803948 RepID=UPI001F3D8C8C|nr:beta-galactosidase [Streptomyces sp. M2CJ-2]
MGCGGANWGWAGAPGSGFTSYDYSAAIAENQWIAPKLAAHEEFGCLQKERVTCFLNQPAPYAASAYGHVRWALRIRFGHSGVLGERDLACEHLEVGRE